MTQISRRILFWFLFIGFAGGSAWWLAAVPHNPDRLLDAIPGHATIVTYHENLADRWDDVRQNSMVQILAGALGVDPQEWVGLSKDPGFRAFIDLACRREMILAYVPNLNYEQGGDWIMASWIGGMSQRLRWSHQWLNIEGLERKNDIGGWPVWTWSWGRETGEQKVTFVLVEGIMVATTAQDPQAVQILVDSVNGNFPSMAVRRDRQTIMQQLVEAAADDRGWYTPPSISGEDYWLVELNLSNSNRMSGAVKTPKPKGYAVAGVKPPWDGLAAIWGEAPLAVAAAGADSAMIMMDQHKSASPLVMLREAMLRSNSDAVALGLFGGEFSGRLKGIKIPALMAAFRTREQIDLASFLPPLVDRWNRIYKFGLVPVSEQVGTQTVWRLEATAGGLYSGFSGSEQVAMLVDGPWLLVSSNFKTLEKLLNRSTDAASPGARLLDEFGAQAGDALGFAGFDLVRSTEAFRLALAAYSLKLMYEDSRGSRGQREKINEAKAWLESLAVMKNLRVRASAGQDIFQFDFEAGP